MAWVLFGGDGTPVIVRPFQPFSVPVPVPASPPCGWELEGEEERIHRFAEKLVKGDFLH
jgi:hypothetical protein